MPDDHELPDNGYIRTQKATSYGGVGLNGKKNKKKINQPPLTMFLQKT